MPFILYGSSGENFAAEADYIMSAFGLSGQPWDGTVRVPEHFRPAAPEETWPSDVSTDPVDRFMHSIGKSSVEILMARNGHRIGRVDAVFRPRYGDLPALLERLHASGSRATVFGGGTSVTGALIPGQRRFVIDTSNLRGISVSKGRCTVGAGMRGPEIEGALNRENWTLGHFPESFMHSTAGGWVSTKATGQESNQYGGIEDMVISATCVRSDGTVEGHEVPRESGPNGRWAQAIGSEGRFGVITTVTLRTHRLPRSRFYASRFFRSFEEGIGFLSSLDRFPTVARLSDTVETGISLAVAGDGALTSLARRYLRFRGLGDPSMLVVVNNEMPAKLPDGGVSLGALPARKWEEGRFQRPGLANRLWMSGVVPDTLETSADWDRLPGLYHGVREAFGNACSAEGIRGIIMAHVSHLYTSGACMYFTFLLQGPLGVGQLVGVRNSVVRAFLRHGGSLTHHHGIGRLLLPFAKHAFDHIERDGVVGW
ncbi:alkyldihydroxyacetonephosphate synthase [Thermogymnomonas acidicola]|uniref:Alkyldihydroxyacetonephosphate synthase n=1 Tax=Thermogymnomonas acidicola TaxID=399579 RepID=A0AA37F9W0_9ARCH|nr:alkyldihydroxyacetonephosphate synthase [Thermogymnomonas acidicola]